MRALLWVVLALCASAVLTGLWLVQAGTGSRNRQDRHRPTESPALYGREPMEPRAVAPSGTASGTGWKDGFDSVAAARAAIEAAVAGGDLAALERAMAVLARAICDRPSRAPEALSAATELDRSGRSRSAAAVLLALGRCGHDDVLAALLALVRDRSGATGLRAAAVLALAQRRDVAREIREGCGFAKGDAIMDSPIAEADVRAAVLDLLREARSARTGDWGTEIVVNAVIALGGSASIDRDVAVTLLEIVAKEPGLAPTALAAMQSAGPSPHVEDAAVRIVLEHALPTETLTAAMLYLARVAPGRALRAFQAVMNDESADAAHRLAIVRGLSAMLVVPEAEAALLETCALSAWEWARSTELLDLRRANAQGESPQLLEGATTDLRVDVFPLLSSALTALRARAAQLHGPAAEAFHTRLSMAGPPTPTRTEQLAADLATRGGLRFAEALLAHSEAKPLQLDQFVAVVRGLRRALPPSDWASLAPVIDRISSALPDDARASVEAARK